MPRATLPGWTGAATRRLCGTSGFQGSPIQAAPLTKRPQLQAAGIVWHAAASDYASLLPMTATLHSGRVGVKQFASQAIEPIGGGGPGGGAWTASAAAAAFTWRCVGTAAPRLTGLYLVRQQRQGKRGKRKTHRLKNLI